jgi:N-acetylneuraminate synthase
VKEKKVKIIAEVGCNHKGDLAIAREMIITAATFCKVDVIKFQKRNPKELLSQAQYNASHPNSYNAYGKTYGEHREFLEFNLDQHKQLKEWCEEFNIEYSSSVWDVTSAKQLVSLNPKLIKVPSPSNLHWEMLAVLAAGFEGEIHISLGMTTKKEEAEIVEFFANKNRLKDVVFYACTSGYPVEFEDLCLLEIDRLKKLYESSVKAIGFSGHHNGIAADIAAMTLGVSWIERHYTLNRTWKGTDHAASLEPDGLRRLVRDISNIGLALTYKNSELLQVELPQRDKLKWQEKSLQYVPLKEVKVLQMEG